MNQDVVEKVNSMRKFEKYTKRLTWSTTLLLSVAGCGDIGSGASAPMAPDTGVVDFGRGPTPINLRITDRDVIGANNAAWDINVKPMIGAGTGLICVRVSRVANNVEDNPRSAPDMIRSIAAFGDDVMVHNDATGPAPGYAESADGLQLVPAIYKKWHTEISSKPTDVAPTSGANPVWIFQTAQGLTLCTSSLITPTDSAPSQKIYW